MTPKPDTHKTTVIQEAKLAKTYDCCVLDLETTGLNLKRREIIEVGILKIRNGRPVEKMDVLIQPKKLPIPARITEITGITTEMVQDAPSIEDVSWWIWDFIGEDTIVGYNVRFDLSFLQKYAPRPWPGVIRYLDLLPWAKKLYPELGRHSLSTMRDVFDLHKNTHRALDDCITTWQLMVILKKDLEFINRPGMRKKLHIH